MTAPVISVLPDAPQRGVDSQEVFTSKANPFVDSLGTLVSETNTMGTWMNTTASEVESDRIASAASASAAASSSSSASSSATTATTKASEASSSATSASSSAVVASTAATTATTKASEASSSASSASTSATTATTKASEASASAASASGSANTSSTQASIAIQKATEAGNSANSAAASAANAALSLGDYRGDYYAPTSYIAGQSVSYNGSIYIAKQGTTGNLPTNTTYWFKGTGAAAVYDVTASATDNTVGRLLKVGDGGVIEGIYFNGNIDTIIANGTYKLFESVTGIPEGASGLGDHLVHQTWDVNAATQQYYEYSAKRMYTRQYKDGAWQSWERVLQTNDVTTSATDTTAGRLLTVGAKIEQLDVDGTNVKYEAPIKPTLDLDFANQDFTIYSKTEGFVKKPLADIVSQGRATAGSSVDAIGGVTEFASGENRFTFDGETGEALGYLSEESRTNLLTNSEFPNGLSDAPSRGGLVTLSSMNLGNGAVNALAFGYDGATVGFARKTNFTPIIGTTYTISVFVEMDDGSPPLFQSASLSSPENDFVFHLAGGSESPLLYTVEKTYGNSYRISFTRTATTTNSLMGIYKYATNSPRTFKVTGFQLEVGSFPTSYIKTLGSPVTRSVDSMTRTLGQEWNPNDGTFVVEFDGLTGSYPRVIHMSGSGSDEFRIYRDSISATINSNFSVRVQSGANASAITGIPSASKRILVSYISGSSVSVSSDAGYYSSIATANFPSELLALFISCLSVSGANNANGTIKRLTYYPRAFDAATLQRLSRI